jgi:hypothetical protein
VFQTGHLDIEHPCGFQRIGGTQDIATDQIIGRDIGQVQCRSLPRFCFGDILIVILDITDPDFAAAGYTYKSSPTDTSPSSKVPVTTVPNPLTENTPVDIHPCIAIIAGFGDFRRHILYRLD